MAQSLLKYLCDLEEVECAEAHIVFTLCEKALSENDLTESQRVFVSLCHDIAKLANANERAYNNEYDKNANSKLLVQFAHKMQDAYRDMISILFVILNEF